MAKRTEKEALMIELSNLKGRRREMIMDLRANEVSMGTRTPVDDSHMTRLAQSMRPDRAYSEHKVNSINNQLRSIGAKIEHVELELKRINQ